MFGIGFTELLLITIIAILFLGPDKLPQTMVEIAKFIKSVKKTIGEAKSSLEEEMKIAELKEEALSYKQKLDDATSELKNFKNIDFDDFDDLNYNDKTPSHTPQNSTTPAKAADPYAQAPREPELSSQDVTSVTQVEPKNDTVTYKKKSKEKPKKHKEENNDKTDTPKDDA